MKKATEFLYAERQVTCFMKQN